MHLVLVCALLIFFPHNAFGEWCRALLACDTMSELKVASRQDLSHIKTTLHEAALSSGLKLKTEVLSDRSLISENVLAWIQSIEEAPGGVVVFYYSGHGYLTPGSSLPFLSFPSHHQSFRPEEILQRLTATSSRLIIIILDCCCTVRPLHNVKGMLVAKSSHPQVFVLPGFKTILAQCRGSIVVVGASPGQPAFAYESGSLFTNSLIQALYSECAFPDVSWQKIFDRTTALCAPTQKPLVSLNISPITTQEPMTPTRAS
jgi:hypothetical protein